MMDIYSPPGTVVIFTASGGYEYQQEEAKKVLKLGERYTVRYTDVHSSSSEVFLKEVPGSFNTCMFEDPRRRILFKSEPDLSGDAYCTKCCKDFHYSIEHERGMYRDEKGVLRLECPNCLARNES